MCLYVCYIHHVAVRRYLMWYSIGVKYKTINIDAFEYAENNVGNVVLITVMNLFIDTSHIWLVMVTMRVAKAYDW